MSSLFFDLRKRALAKAGMANTTAAHALRALDVADTIAAARTQARDSAEGRESARRAISKVALRLALSEAGVARDRAAIAKSRDVLRQRALSNFDSSIAGKNLTALRDMKFSEKVRYAAEDPRVLAALMSSPEFGVSREALEPFVEQHIERSFPKELERIADREEAAAVAEAAIQVARDIIYRAGGFRHHQAMEEYLAENGTPTDAQLSVEAAGGTAPGLPSWSLAEALDATESEALYRLPK